jgi:hypothetical protein
MRALVVDGGVASASEQPHAVAKSHRIDTVIVP